VRVGTMTKSEGPGRRYQPNPAKTMPPRMRCPVCQAQAFTRTSEEISPESRRLYYACSAIHCGMTFSASLTVEKVISPSAISASFRPAVQRDRRPPGHEYGQTLQMGLFDPPDEPSPSAA
jgi:hypothetical protein